MYICKRWNFNFAFKSVFFNFVIDSLKTEKNVSDGESIHRILVRECYVPILLEKNENLQSASLKSEQISKGKRFREKILRTGNF